MKLVNVKIKDLKNNSGQIEGLPKNPRILKDDKFIKLKKSLEDDPEMIELREVIAYDNNGELIVICGNMRLKALKELGIKEVPTKILPTETTVEKLKAYTIKDNVSFGDHDFEMLTNEWDVDLLEEWGLDLPNYSLGLDVNNMTEDDIDVEEEFDPIGLSKGLTRLVIIFDNITVANEWIEKNNLNIEYKKRGNDENIILQVNMSSNYGV